MRKVVIWIVVILLVISMTVPGMLQFFQNQVTAPESDLTASGEMLTGSVLTGETSTGLTETGTEVTLSGSEQ